MNSLSLLKGFSVKRLTEQDVSQIYELFMGNPLYFLHCPPSPSDESIRQDMRALPPGKTYEDKHYIGLFAGDCLVAVLDLITSYPKETTLFIGFFMLRSEEQGKGLGTEIVSELCNFVRKRGFTHIRLGYVKGNPQSKAFWEKNHFVPTGIETQSENYTIVILERDLSA